MRRKYNMARTVQTILFDRAQWSDASARNWLYEHGYSAPAVDTTTHFLRYRQADPDPSAQLTAQTDALTGDVTLSFDGVDLAILSNPENFDLTQVQFRVN